MGKYWVYKGELEKMFHIFSNSIGYKILVHGGMRFKNSVKSY